MGRRDDAAAGPSAPAGARVALLMNRHAYAGREYLRRLREAGVPVDVIELGDYPVRDDGEEARCGGRWTPPTTDELSGPGRHLRFESLRDPRFIEWLGQARYDAGIQGGTGILRPPVFEAFRLGLLNFHPGALPAYRGCSAPEWQALHNEAVVCTCHLVDAGIDTGPIVDARALDVACDSYEGFRASIYPQVAVFVADVVRHIVERGALPEPPRAQSEKGAQYRPVMGPDDLARLKQSFPPTTIPHPQ